MRRIPYIKIIEDKVKYICPQCRNEIPRDMYKSKNECPICYSNINRTCKAMMRVYKDIDDDLYNYFIQLLRR